MTIKLEEYISLRKSVNKMNLRIGDEIIDDSESSLDEEQEERENFVNTRHYEIDGQFAPRYYFITNVSSFIMAILKKILIPNWKFVSKTG